MGEYQEASAHPWRGSARPGLAHGGLATSAPQLSRRRPKAGLLWRRRAMEEAAALQGEDDVVAGWGGGRGTSRHHGGRELGRPGCTSNERISKIKMQRCAQEVLAIPLDQSRCHLSGLVGKTTQRCHHHS